MFNGKAKLLEVCLLGSVVVLSAVSALADERNHSNDKGDPPGSPVAPQAASEMSTQDNEMAALAADFAKEVTVAIEGWVSSGTVSKERLFSYLYYPIADTSPTKFTTDYDRFADRDLQAILDKYSAKSGLLLYAVASDKNGYVPTHNRQYSQPLTGNRSLDLVNNRTKRIFSDQVAFRASRNTKPLLVQRYERDTGEALVDLSVPVNVAGRHWGCVRIGYRAIKQ